MGREGQDPTVLHHSSSIALLQERFRQLQRVKEMREERELLKLLSETKQFFTSSNPVTTNHYEPAKLSYKPEMVIPAKSPPQPPRVSLSLWPTSEEDKRTLEANPVSVSLCPKDYALSSLKTPWKNFCDCDSESDSGVDTSLHL